MSLVLSKMSYAASVVGVDIPVRLRNGTYLRGINFDNAATTPPLVKVMEEITAFAPYYSSIHRGTGYKAEISSKRYEEARKTVMDFVGADSKKDLVIFVKNATEAINKVAYRLSQDESKGVVLSTSMEHHSNDLPWRDKYEVQYIEVDECGRLIFSDLLDKLEKNKGRVKLVTVTGASNVTGYVNPIHRIAEYAHRYGAKILVDASQLVPHTVVDMKPSASTKHLDFLVFSAHKMYAPFGIGVLIGPKDFFTKGNPDYAGGGTVKAVTTDAVVWDDPPSRDEAGTPNLMGVVALVAAIKALSAIGMKNIERHEKALVHQLIQGLRKIDCIEMYCTGDENQERVGIVPFNMKAVAYDKLAKILAGEAGIAVRGGCFCAHPYVQRLLKVPAEKIRNALKNPAEKPGMVRVSFGLYNEHSEVERLLAILQDVAKDRGRYLKIYEAPQLKNRA